MYFLHFFTCFCKYSGNTHRTVGESGDFEWWVCPFFVTLGQMSYSTPTEQGESVIVTAVMARRDFFERNQIWLLSHHFSRLLNRPFSWISAAPTLHSHQQTSFRLLQCPISLQHKGHPCQQLPSPIFPISLVHRLFIFYFSVHFHQQTTAWDYQGLKYSWSKKRRSPHEPCCHGLQIEITIGSDGCSTGFCSFPAY